MGVACGSARRAHLVGDVSNLVRCGWQDGPDRLPRRRRGRISQQHAGWQSSGSLARAGWSIVAASALPTALFSLLTLPAGPGLAPSLAAAWFAGSFVGMTPPARIASLGRIATVGAVLGILLLGLQTTLVGWGGVLGASACACVLACISLERLKK